MLPLVAELKADLHDQPVNPLRPNQMREYQDELAQLGVMAEGRDLDGVKRDFLQSAKGASVRRGRQIQKILDEQAPKRVTGDRASRIHKKIGELLGTVIRPAMLPRSALRRNPPGAVGHLLRTEFNPEFKDAILTVKRGLRALDPENADPDFTNLERFRPEGLNPDGTSTFVAEAQIPGVFAQTPSAKAHWPLGAPTASTALGQVVEREQVAARPARSAKPPKPAKPKRQYTPEQKAEMLSRLRAGKTRAAEARQTA